MQHRFVIGRRSLPQRCAWTQGWAQQSVVSGGRLELCGRRSYPLGIARWCIVGV